MDFVSGLIGTFFGTFLGWFLNEWSASRKERPKLCFQMVGTQESELIEKEYRTKTSPSEYGIEIFNVGRTAVVLDQFSLYYKNETLVDCFLNDTERVLLPNQKIIYTLMEQEADALQYHCNQKHFEKCDVVAHSLDGKVIKGTLDVPLFAIRSNCF